MIIKTKLIPKNTAARSAYTLVPEYITIHNTANISVGADAESHAKYMQGGGKNITASYHYVVDDKEIYKLLPENEVAWHAGDGEMGTGNRRSLSRLKFVKIVMETYLKPQTTQLSLLRI